MLKFDSQDVLRFASLFNGRRDAIGHGEGRVSRRAVTLADYTSHLSGEGGGIGIFPLRDDATVYFAAIDLDEPNFELAAKFQRLIPGTSFIERSRSGNAHVWVFFNKPCPAWVARGWLRHVTNSFGREDVEVFPKQDAVREGGVGNYINLPYHGEERPMLDPDPDKTTGRLYPMSLMEFLNIAGVHLQDPEAWEVRARRVGIQPPQERESTAEWGESPYLHECATHILARSASGEAPLQPGGRHNVLFHVACMLLNWRDCTPEEAWDMIVELNDAAEPPVSNDELNRLFNNAEEGRYTFTGCDDPVMRPYVRPECPIANGEVGR